MPIVVSQEASERERQAAVTLAGYLEKISGAHFQVSPGDGQTGVAVGTAKSFPSLKLGVESGGDGFGSDEQYALRSHAKGMQLVGASEIAVEHAVWDLLYRLGYRQFFPGEHWEVVPRTADLKIAVDVRERPDYAYRSIWYGFGSWDHNADPYRQWLARNRMASGFQLRTGHAYDGILSKHKAEFKAHPEYLGLLGGKRVSSKFCISNPGLRKLVVGHAMEWFAEHPGEQCVSIDPSDGGGWCECEPCRTMGSPSDRALTLANEISAALEAMHLGKYVAMYAYAQHSPPPEIKARPRVIISCATAFIRGGLAIEDIIRGWKEHGVRQFGIREYYSVFTWDHDLPGHARGAQPDYLARTIPHFHSLGARFLSAESSDNWGPNGLGYYLASRMLWNVREAQSIDALRDDFLQKAFGPARRPMAEFYRLINGTERPLMSHDLLGRMYRQLRDAASATSAPAVLSRIDDLVLYTRYVELFRVYENASGQKRQTAFEDLIRHGYRMRTTMMIHAKGLYRDLPNRDKNVRIPAEAGWNVPEPKNPWKSSSPWTREELDSIVERGIAANRTVTFEPASFSHALVPVDEMRLPDVPVLEDGQAGRNEQRFYTWFKGQPAQLDLKVTGGLIAHYRDRGNVRLRLLAIRETEESEVARDASAPPDGKPHEVSLRTDRQSLHKVLISDGGDKTAVLWPAGAHRTFELNAETNLSDRRSGYFYVPRGTRVIGGYGAADSRAVIQDGSAKAVFRFADLDGSDYFEIAVPPGQDGRLWSFHGVTKYFLLLTVPPYAASHPRELLLPKEVVEAAADQTQAR